MKERNYINREKINAEMIINSHWMNFMQKSSRGCQNEESRNTKARSDL